MKKCADRWRDEIGGLSDSVRDDYSPTYRHEYSVGMCVDMSIEVRVGMRIDMSIEVRVGMWIDMLWPLTLLSMATWCVRTTLMPIHMPV